MLRCQAWRGNSCLVWRLRTYWFLKQDVVKVAGGRLVAIAAARTELHCAHPLRISRRKPPLRGAPHFTQKLGITPTPSQSILNSKDAMGSYRCFHIAVLEACREAALPQRSTIVHSNLFT